jgi:arylsulfatase A-like enzyme/tetratricopeptide (TPR) repeat protein
MWVLVCFLALGLGCRAAPREEGDELSARVGIQGGWSEAGAEPLNLVLITVDTLRADRLGSFGSAVETPHFDRLAEEGVLFTNASTTVPFTFPAHSSIFTGTYPPQHGVRENVGYYLGEEHTTLAEMLAAAGWQTAGFVSAFVLDSRWGIARGFEHYFDDFDLAAFESANLGSVQRPGSETIAAALAWLDERASADSSSAPFFLWLHLFDPHDPYTPPEPYRSAYPNSLYDGEVAYTDSLVGGFLDQLQRRKLLESSAVVLTADHGEGLGDHGEAFHGYFVYDSTVHVPLMLRLPGARGRELAGTRVADAVSHVDIVPTLLEIAGVEVPEGLAGKSLLGPVTRSARGAAGGADDDEQRGVYAESFYPLLHYGWAPLRSLRVGRTKYIEAPRAELFDLESDPGEQDNVFATQPRVGRPMARRLRALTDRLDASAPSTTTPDLDEQTLAQLRALGYVAGPGGADAGTYDPDVVRADPKDKAPLHRRLMRAQSLVGQSEEPAILEAERLLREALEDDPQLLDAHQMLGDLALRSGQPGAAAEHFEQALALDSEHRPSLFGLASSFREAGRLDDALLGFRRLLSLAGQDSKTTLAIADIEVERGELDAAAEVLGSSVKPGAPALLANRLGEVQALRGESAAARASFELALRDGPRLAQPHFNLAVLSEEAGDFDAAMRHYSEAIDLAPKHFQAQFNLARLAGRLGQRERELEMLERSIASKPDFALGHFFLGKALMERGELARAEEITRAGLAELEESQLGWFVLADILNRRGRPDEARRAVDRGNAVRVPGED